MKKQKKFVSVKTKLIIIFTFVLFLLSISNYLYIPSKIKEIQIREIDNKIHAFADIISTSIGHAVFLQDTSAINDLLIPLIKSKKISYIVIRSKNDSIIYKYNLPSAIEQQYYIDCLTEHVSKDKFYYKVNALIVYNGQTIGEIYLGYTLNMLNAEIDSIKREIGGISIIIFVIGYFLIFLLSNFLTTPIMKMFETVEKIKTGDFTQRAHVYYNDEIGVLAKSINMMINKISETNNELETRNTNLETKVQKRTQELESMNTKRKRAEWSYNKSEESFKRLFENTIFGIFRVAKGGKIIMVNTALLKILGLNSIKEINNYENTNQYIGYLDPSMRTKIRRNIKKDEKIFVFENKWKKVDGSIIYIRESVHAVKDKKDNFLYYEGIVEDITDNKSTEIELIETKKKAESADKIKSQFFAQISHEIRTPINSILSFSQLLKDELRDVIPEELKFGFDMIDNGGRRLIRTIELILNISDIQNGNQEIKPETVNVYNNILVPIVNEFKSAAISNNLDLQMVNNLKSEKTCYIDIYTVTQIIVHLMDNAIKYTKEGYIKVIVYLNKENALCVDIKDTGIGIAKEFQSRLFNYFTQEEQGYTRRYEGNGLGMALVKEYCMINNMTVNVKSEKGLGSTFTLVFPKI